MRAEKERNKRENGQHQQDENKQCNRNEINPINNRAFASSVREVYTNCSPCGKHFDAVDMLMTPSSTSLDTFEWNKMSSFFSSQSISIFMDYTEWIFLFLDEVANFSTFNECDHVWKISAHILRAEIFDFTCLLRSRLIFLIEICTRNKCVFWWEFDAHGKHIFHTLSHSFFPPVSHHSILLTLSHGEWLCVQPKWPWQS